MEDISIIELLIGTIIAIIVKNDIIKIIILIITNIIILFNIFLYLKYWHNKGII